MEVKERNAIIASISLIVGFYLAIYPLRMSLIMIFSLDPTYFFLHSFGYLTFDLLPLVIVLFLYAYFLIKPIKKLSSKDSLALGTLNFGVFLILFPGIFAAPESPPIIPLIP